MSSCSRQVAAAISTRIRERRHFHTEVLLSATLDVACNRSMFGSGLDSFIFPQEAPLLSTSHEACVEPTALLCSKKSYLFIQEAATLPRNVVTPVTSQHRLCVGIRCIRREEALQYLAGCSLFDVED